MNLSNWQISFTSEAQKDLQQLDGSIRPQVVAAIRKVSTNPLPQREGGYGMELGNKSWLDLTGCLKIKLKKAGIRIIYQIERRDEKMNVIIIGLRAEQILHPQQIGLVSTTSLIIYENFI